MLFTRGDDVDRNGGSGFGAGTGRGPAATAFLKNFAEKFCTNSQGKSGSATALMILRGLRSRGAIWDDVGLKEPSRAGNYQGMFRNYRPIDRL